MPIETIWWADGGVGMIDQTRLPEELVKIVCPDLESLWEAIRLLRVRGAPALGCAGALGLRLAGELSRAVDREGFLADVSKAGEYLSTSRPTAVNLSWAIERALTALELSAEENPDALRAVLARNAEAIVKEDKELGRRIGEHGAVLIKDGFGCLTHCNAGGLATAQYGTALAVFFAAHDQGKKFQVYADETRPLLQGARLTTWELMEEGILVTLICDNVAGMVMQQGKINLVVVGADRIAANGDTANKIGTYSVAVLAKHHNIPFYVAAPYSTFDLSLPDGSGIPIEERGTEEVTRIGNRQLAPEGCPVYSPAFDVTPAELITGIITEHGIIELPTREKIAAALGESP